MIQKAKFAVLYVVLFAVHAALALCERLFCFRLRLNSVSNPSDFFIPEVCLDYASQAFTQSLGVMQNLVGPVGSGAPIEVMNEPIMGIADMGQYYQRPVFNRMGSGAVVRRDVTSNSDTTPVNLTGTNEIAVKMNRRCGPIDMTVDSMRLTKATPAEVSAEIGNQIGQEMALNIQTTIIAAAVGIIGGVSGAANTKTVWAAASRTNLSPSLLNAALALMGDYREQFRRSARILTRSEALQDMIDDATGRGFQGVANLALQGTLNTNTYGMGDPIIVDSANLTVADAGFDKCLTLLLGAGFMQIWFPLPLTIYEVFQTTLPEQVLRRWRADFDFCIGAHGCQYDTVNGGANPTNAAIATTTNWDSNFTRHQEVKGIEIVHNASGFA